MSFVVFDLETTGFEPESCVVIEICGKKLDDNLNEIGRYHSFCSYDDKLPKKIKELTGIDDEMLVGAPKEADALSDFMSFVGDSILVAHNYNFDGSFLAGRGVDVKNAFYCTLSMARKLFPFFKGHSLANMNNELYLGLTNHHRSEYDVNATIKLFRIAFQMMRARGIDLINTIYKKDRDKELIPSATYLDFVPERIEFYFTNSREPA